jgi:hypothetical protein
MSVVIAQPEVLAPRQFGAKAAGVHEMVVNHPSKSSVSYALTEAAEMAATG